MRQTYNIYYITILNKLHHVVAFVFPAAMFIMISFPGGIFVRGYVTTAKIYIPFCIICVAMNYESETVHRLLHNF